MKTFIGLLALAAAVSASPLLQNVTFSHAFWKDTSAVELIGKLETECIDREIALSCMKYKFLQLLDQVLSKASIKVSENTEAVKNEESSRSTNTEMDFLDTLENYMKSQELVTTLPGSYFQGTTLTLSPRNIDQNEMTFSLKFSSDERKGKALEKEEGRKHKLKKIIVPILVFIILKAMTLVPLAIGVLGIKAWNALQLSFFAFVVSLALAIFQLCKKLASDHTSAQVAAHGPWDNYQASHYAARAFPDDLIEHAHNLAYNAFSQS